MREIKAVVDTNIFVSALIGKGKLFKEICSAFIEGKFTPILSLEMQSEIFDVVRRPKFKKYFNLEEIKRFEELIKTDSNFVFPRQKVAVCRDIKDNIILEAALAAEKIDCIVTGDQDLITLKTFHKISILTPTQFLKKLKE